MDYEGHTLSTQGSVDNLNARVTVLETTVVTLQGEIDTINTVISGLVLKIDTLSESAVGIFAPYNFTATSAVNLNFVIPITVIGNALFIPYEHMADGMTIRYTVWASVQCEAQDFRLYLSQINNGTIPYTSTAYESIPDTGGQVLNRRYTFTVIVKDRGPGVPTVSSITEITSGYIRYLDPVLTSFFDNNGMGFFLIAQWATVTGLQNFTISNLLIERVSGFL